MTNYQALKNFERANVEATKGTHMAPTFKGFLGCVQIKIFSSVMLECASTLEGIQCFSPINCLTKQCKSAIAQIIVDGLKDIIEKAKQKRWNGKLKISMKTQNTIDPYLAAIYNTYSIASGLTDPYCDSSVSVKRLVKFAIDSTYIAEGEEDCCKLEVVLHDDMSVVLFIWKKFMGSDVHVFMRHNKTTWNLEATHGSKFDIEYDTVCQTMKNNNVEMDKVVGWPIERKSIKELLSETSLKKEGKLSMLSKETYKWMKRVPEQYLNGMEIDLEQVDKSNSTLLHHLADLNEFKNMKRILNNIQNIDPIDSFGSTPLHRACTSSSFETAKLLIEHGANVNFVTKNGDSPLMLLAKNKKHSFSLLKMLFEYNANKSITNNDGMRAIDIAILTNGKDWLKKMLFPKQRTNIY